MSFDTPLSATTRPIRRIGIGSVCAALGLAVGGSFFGLMLDLVLVQDAVLRRNLVNASPHVWVGSQPVRPRQQRTLVPVGERTVLEVVKNVPPSSRSELKPYVELAARLEQLDPDIRAVSPHVVLQGIYRNGPRYQLVTAMGVLSRKERSIALAGTTMREGSFDALDGTPAGTVIAAGLAERLGVGVGGRVSFITAGGTIRQMVVVGVFEGGPPGIDDWRAYIPLGAAQTLLGMQRNAVSGLSIQVADIDRAERVRDRVEQTIGYRAVTWEEENGPLLEFQSKERRLMWIVAALALIAGTVGVRNALLPGDLDGMVHELRGGGKRRSTIVAGMLVGLAGGLAACVLLIMLPLLPEIQRALPFQYDPIDTRISSVTIAPCLVAWCGSFLSALLCGMIGGVLSARSVRLVRFGPSASTEKVA